jgi:hypothetical protein
MRNSSLVSRVNDGSSAIKQAMRRSILTIVAVLGLLALSPAAFPQQDQVSPDILALSPGFSPDPIEVQGVSGGMVPANQAAGQEETPTGACVGFVDTPPDHTVELKGYFDYLKIQLESAEDTTIVIRGPGGTWCNDDFQDKNAGVEGQWLEGPYQIWVGTYNKDKAIPYSLRISASR